MGRDSLPDHNLVPKHSSIHCNKSVNSVDYFPDFSPTLSHHRRIRTSLLFREVPTFLQQQCFEDWSESLRAKKSGVKNVNQEETGSELKIENKKESRNNIEQERDLVSVLDFHHHSLSPHHESTSDTEELQEMQEKFQQLRIEKKQTEELLKAREETLKIKEEELETRGEEQEKLQTKLKKLQKMKEFKPTMQKEKDPLKPKQPMSAFFMFTNERRVALLTESKSVWEIAKQNKEKYLEEMEAYKKRKEEESANLKKEEDEMMKIHKQEALQLLKKKEKTDNIIKKTKKKRQKKKKIVDPNKPKKPASSFLLFSKEARKNLLEERPGINKSILNALISVKWKELSEEDKQTWNEKAAGAKEPRWNWKSTTNLQQWRRKTTITHNRNRQIQRQRSLPKLASDHSSYNDGITEEDLFSCELWSSSSRRVTGTAIKKLLAEEMSKETESKRRPLSVIARLMGFDGLLRQPLHRQHEEFSESYQYHRKGMENHMNTDQIGKTQWRNKNVRMSMKFWKHQRLKGVVT
ncbi:unnamed protein product [Camellia sinensis]